MRKFLGAGIYADTTGASSKLLISNSLSTDNLDGLLYQPPSGPETFLAVIDHFVASNSSDGVAIDATAQTSGSVNVSITNSVLSGNGVDGFFARGSAGPTYSQTIDSTVLNANGHAGLSTPTASVVHLSRSVLNDNGSYGIDANTGLVFTAGNNQVNGNRVSNLQGSAMIGEALR